MNDVAHRGAAAVAALAAALVWLAPGLEPPTAAQPTAGTVEKVVDRKYEGCTFRLVNRYEPEDGTQYARTRQVWSDGCRFGSRNWSIRVRVCFAGAGTGSPVDCSSALMPTSDEPYAESKTTSPVPKGSIHYVEIRGATKWFSLPAPAQAGPSTPPPGAPPTSTLMTAEPSPADSRPPDRQGVTQAQTSRPELREAGQQRPDSHYGLGAALAAGGMALLLLGVTGIWLLRRGESGGG
jgi:hypothetical protein